MQNERCKVCKKKASQIFCKLCENQSFFCSTGHYNFHMRKTHPKRSPSRQKDLDSIHAIDNYLSYSKHKKEPEVDMRRLFEHIQELKQEIDINIDKYDYVEAIMNITKCLTLSKKFYAEDHLFNLELLFKLANSYIQINNIEEAINNLDKLLGLTEYNKNEVSIPALRYKSHMLIGSACINIGDYSKVIFGFYFQLGFKSVYSF